MQRDYTEIVINMLLQGELHCLELEHKKHLPENQKEHHHVKPHKLLLQVMEILQVIHELFLLQNSTRVSAAPL